MARHREELERATERALSALELPPHAPAWDAWLDADGMGEALQRQEPVLLRLLVPPEPSEGAVREPGATSDLYGPEPRDPLWARLDARGLRLADYRHGALHGPFALAAVQVSVVGRPCCTSPRCHARCYGVEVVLVGAADGGGGSLPRRLILAQAERRDELSAANLGIRIGALAARRFGVALELEPRLRELVRGAAGEAGDASEERLSARELARWSAQREGELVVLRDHTTRGPRDLAAFYVVLAVAALVGAVICGYFTAESLAVPSYPGVIGYGAAAVVLTIGIYTFGSIARFASQYRAPSVALVSLGADRVVFSPWASRAGAVDAYPSGRFGAAQNLGEIVDIDIAGSLDLVARSAHHGPFALGQHATTLAADRWQRGLLELVAALRHDAAPALGAVGSVPEPAAAD